MRHAAGGSEESNEIRGGAVLSAMVERLLASMAGGPAMNCRPHHSRQRIDLTALSALGDISPNTLLASLLSGSAKATATAQVEAPSASVLQRANRWRRPTGTTDSDAAAESHSEPLSVEEKLAARAWESQHRVLNKLRAIAEDARAYEQDTGVAALSLGFPLLSVPPTGRTGGGGRGAGRRILAPVAFVPLHLDVRQGVKTRINFACRGEGAGRVAPNDTLLLWLAQQSGRDATAEVELFEDPDGDDPWRELRELIRHIAEVTEIPIPDGLHFTDNEALSSLVAAPTAAKADTEGRPQLLPAAVLGLYPAASQGLLRDMQAMADGEELNGPVRSFVYVSERLGDGETPATGPRNFAGERMVAQVDPCQRQAVRLARTSRGLVVHGPPGTGKSQTITNIIADHLGRGERVLFVCDKRTALDVVHNRLDYLGLGGLCALIHDPQRDRADFYRAVRAQLESLADARPNSGAAKRLEEVDHHLAEHHAELNRYHEVLHQTDASTDPAMSLHDLIGRWLEAYGTQVENISIDSQALATVSPSELETVAGSVVDAIERASLAGWNDNPWRQATGVTLQALLGMSASDVQQSVAAVVTAAEKVDKVHDPAMPPFNVDRPLQEQASQRVAVASQLADVNSLDPVWATLIADANARTDALKRLDQVAPHAQALHHALPDPTLLERAGDLSSTEANERREALRAFLRSLQSWGSRVVAAIAGAGSREAEARTAALRWLNAGLEARQKAKRQLDTASGLADTVAASEPDPALLLQFKRSNPNLAQLADQRVIVATYESAAKGFFGFLAFGKKKAAIPVLASLGLPADASSATRARDFLEQIQARVDLAETLSVVIGTPVDDQFDGVALVAQYRLQRHVLKALAAEPTAGTPIPEATLAAIAEALPEAPAARLAVEALGLSLAPSDATRAATFYKALIARDGLRNTRRRLFPEAEIPADSALAGDHAAASLVLRIAAEHADDRILCAALAESIRENTLPDLQRGLAASPARAEGIAGCIEAARSAGAGLFEANWILEIETSLRDGAMVTDLFRALQARLDGLENVVRVREAIAALPPALAEATQAMMAVNAEPHLARLVLRREVDAGEIRRRLEAAPDLLAADAKRLRDALDAYRQLHAEKLDLVRDVVLDRWIDRQRDRLLAGSGNRLNGTAANLRRRLMIRGKKVMRLRQMVQAGHDVEGGDPLFDVCPVWMASPETVAQVFPREPVFDVVVFDEASQVRLEEALPVLTRAKRVVIAGDPKQLPPTRFFETAIATSEEEEPETDQELFESQQAETEDLLSAALGLDIQQSFLDVHYRSRNADLIGFSNAQFYGSRLQPIPGHPAHRTPYAPLRIYRADGVYADRVNEVEAEQVVQIVRDLLKWAEPPSIGIACFNLPQRDLILERLDDAATADPEFATRLAASRERRGGGGFEGLFVKNLENVQGDERDHLIVSTTYGPSPDGKFRRNFGPVSQTGGGRRLNVLVTRARSEIHLVTSIPESEYRNLPPIPEGQQATGRWLLYAYLHYAESLERLYATPATDGEGSAVASTGVITRGSTARPSRLADALAPRLAKQPQPVQLYWGNDGLGIDLVLGEPGEPVSTLETGVRPLPVGVLCDLTRFGGTDDPIEWEAFRTAIHESQGWNLHRLWSPALFRDPSLIQRLPTG